MQSAQCLLPWEESITVSLRSLMELSISFSFWVTWHKNKTYKTVVPCCSSIPLSLLGSIWEFMRTLVQHVKKCFGDQSQAKVPCPSNLRHMFKNNSLHFKWSSRSNFKFSRTPEKLFSFCSTSAQAKVCESECVFSSEQINCVQRLCIKSAQPILSLSTEPDWYDPKTSCLFAALLPFLPWKQMQSPPIHSVCHSICEGLLLVPYSSGCPMFLGSPQPSQQNDGKSIPSSKQLSCAVSTSCSCFFCSFSAAAAPPTATTVNLSSLQEWQIPRTSLDIFRPCYAKCTVFAAFGGIYHGRIEVADGIFHSLQLLGYLTQEQDIQNSCSMLFQYPSVFAWKHLIIHEKFGSACEEMFWRSKPSKSALSIEP